MTNYIKNEKKLMILFNSNALEITYFFIDNENINLGMLNKSGCTLKLMTRNGC